MFQWIQKINLKLRNRGVSGPVEVKKICGIRGEQTPGELTVDIAVYNEAGEVVPYPTETHKLKIDKKIRPSVNRVLSGTDTQDDLDVLDLWVSKHLV